MGISLSGGGIRSAAYCLGALQTLEATEIEGKNFLRNARYLSAVSGGSYAATAVTLLAVGKRAFPTSSREFRALHEDGPERTANDDREAIQVPETDDDLPGSIVDVNWQAADDNNPDGRPFFPGTPEEQYLRNRTLYLTHGPGGVAGVIWRVLLGVLLNVSVLAAGLNMVARPAGWLYGWRIPALRVNCRPSIGHSCTLFAIPTPFIGAVLAAAIVATFLGFVWIAYPFKHDPVRPVVGGASGAFIVLAIVLAVVLIGLPELLYWMGLVFHKRPGVGATPAVTTTTVQSLGGAGAGAMFLAAWSFAKRLVTAPTDSEKTLVGWLRNYNTRYHGLVVNILAFIAGPLLTLAGAVLLIHWAAGHPPGTAGNGIAHELLWWGVPTGLLAVFWWRADLVAWSLHSMYKLRLSAAFALCRIIAPRPPTPTTVKGQDARARSYKEWYALSQCQPPDPFPEVLICAAANVSDYGDTPTGANVTSFVFSGREIGGPLVGGLDTITYEKRLGKLRANPITLPLAMAISGAAFSPSMGRMTRVPWRYLMAVANLRLGVWVPNPRRVQDSLVTSIRPFYPLRPRPHYLLKEMLGLNHLDAPFLYVTDGGHYENLGLVELIRRRCRWIWCLDASGDAINTFSTLGGAVALARAELQVEIDIDPTTMAPGSDPASSRYVRATHCRGTIRYPDGSTGTLVVVKAGVPVDAPWDVESFHRDNSKFPCDPTTDQLYDADRFDAYHTLGAFSMQTAITAFGDEAASLL